MKEVSSEVIGNVYGEGRGTGVDNARLIAVNKAIRNHPVETVGARLRASMTAMKPIL
jgi:ketol-acid reductoisomerase